MYKKECDSFPMQMVLTHKWNSSNKMLVCSLTFPFSELTGVSHKYCVNKPGDISDQPGT